MTMTRETKVGLVVCLSFLCLVGVVLGTKLRGGATDDDEQTIDDPQPVATSEHAPPPAATIPTQVGGAGSPAVIQAGAFQGAQPLPPPPSAQQDNSASQRTTEFDLPPPDTQEMMGPPAPTSVAGIPAPSPSVPDPTIGAADLTSLENSADVVVVPLWGPLKKSALSTSLAAAPQASNPLGGDGPAAPAPNSERSGPSGLSDVPPPSTEVKEQALPAPASPPLVKEQNSPVPVEDVPMPTAIAPSSPTPSAEARGANPSVASPKSPKPGDITLLVTRPPPATTTIPPSATLLPPSGAARADGGVMPNRAPVSPPAADTAPAPQPRPAPPAQAVVQASARDNPRPVGATPTASTPSITVPSPGAALSSRPAAPVTPQVESYDEETYRLKAGDTFARISVAHFNTDKYAKALERFNVAHPQAGDNMRLDPPRLDAGQVIYIPPAYILEKRYGVALIPGYKAQPEAAAANESPRTVNAAPRAESTGNAPPGFKWYQVSPTGQSMRDIARAALGNPERWTDVSKLNPTIDPAYAVRGGLLIKVPADARIPTANTPQTEAR